MPVEWMDPKAVLTDRHMDKWDPYEDGKYMEVIFRTKDMAVILRQP